MNKEPAEASERLLDVRAIAALIACSKRTVWRMIRRGELPPPIRMSHKMSRWKKSVIDQWLRDLR